MDLLRDLNREWEEAEAAVEDHDYQQAVRAALLDSQRMAEANALWTSTRTRVKSPVQYTSGYADLEVREAAVLRDREALDHQRRKLRTEKRAFERLKRRFAPYGHLLPRDIGHRRRSGKTLTDEERRCVLHLSSMLEQEVPLRFVSTAAPLQRAARYLGMATKTIRDAREGIKSRDKRGRYVRTLSSREYEAYILNRAKEWNMEGTAVTLKKIHKSLRDNWGGTHQIPSIETLRRHLHKIGLKYDRTDKTKNYIETLDIATKRRHYLRERYSDKYKDSLFVWLDESYIHHHHVHNKV